MKDKQLVTQLLDLSSELTIKGDETNALVCTMAAARLLAIPHVANQIQHPAKGVAYELDQVIREMFTPPTQEK